MLNVQENKIKYHHTLQMRTQGTESMDFISVQTLVACQCVTMGFSPNVESKFHVSVKDFLLPLAFVLIYQRSDLVFPPHGHISSTLGPTMRICAWWPDCHPHLPGQLHT